MLFSIWIRLGWRNIFRNKRRSLIAGVAIGVGLASLIFVDALMKGMENNMMEAATSTFLGQAEIQRRGFRGTRQTDLTIRRLSEILAKLAQDARIKNFSVRAISHGMVSSPSDVSSVELVGVDPTAEKEVSEIDEAIVRGSYFTGQNPQDIVIGYQLAETLQVTLGDRLVVTVSQVGTGLLSQDLFRVSGLCRFNIPAMDRGMAFVRLSKAREALGIGGNAHQIVLMFKNPEDGSNAALPFWGEYTQDDNEALGWPQLLPQMAAAFRLARFSIYLTGLMLFGVVALGIINTLFMSLHERLFEFGVLKALGTRPEGIAGLIVCEAGSLAILSSVLGCILGGLITLLASGVGIDYTGIEYAGVTIRKLIFPVLSVWQFIEYPLWVIFFTVLAGFYPALIAAGIPPAAAMRQGQ